MALLQIQSSSFLEVQHQISLGIPTENLTDVVQNVGLCCGSYQLPCLATP